MPKKQTSRETSTFGSKFVAMKQAVECVLGLRYKIRIFGIPYEDPTFVYNDNQSVIANTSVQASMLKKKYNSIDFHLVLKGHARYEWRSVDVSIHKTPQIYW